MTVFLDSTVLIDALRKNPQSTAMLAQLLRSGHTLATSVVNVGEVYSGTRAHEMGSAEQLFQGIDAYPVTFAIARHAGELRNSAARKGRTLELDDMLVAATAIELDVPLVTSNRKDFKGTGVALYSPAED